MAQTALYEYGKSTLHKYKQVRQYFCLEDIEDVENIENVIKYIQNRVLFEYKTYKLVKRNSGIDFYMKWHIDDVAVMKTKRENIQNIQNHENIQNNENHEIVLQGKYKLYHTSDRPVYTAIIYLSEHNKDFTGGEFEFVDEKIIPHKHYILFFDSREVHRVLPVKSGNRETLVIKFYR